MTVKVTRLLADGDTVVAVTDVTVGNETCENVEVFTLRDGKTVAVQVQTDTAMMERVYGKKAGCRWVGERSRREVPAAAPGRTAPAWRQTVMMSPEEAVAERCIAQARHRQWPLLPVSRS